MHSDQSKKSALSQLLQVIPSKTQVSDTKKSSDVPSASLIQLLNEVHENITQTKELRKELQGEIKRLKDIWNNA